MTITPLARRARAAAVRELAIARGAIAALPAVRSWAWDRAHERSTYLGLAAVAGALGRHSLADHLSQAADAIVFALAFGGGALAAANTSRKEGGQ